jgi:hypothetical protein
MGTLLPFSRVVLVVIRRFPQAFDLHMTTRYIMPPIINTDLYIDKCMTAVRILLLIGFVGCLHHGYDFGAAVMFVSLAISTVIEEQLRTFINKRKR